jgi:hypothetical protein
MTLQLQLYGYKCIYMFRGTPNLNYKIDGSFFFF